MSRTQGVYWKIDGKRKEDEVGNLWRIDDCEMKGFSPFKGKQKKKRRKKKGRPTHVLNAF